MSFILKEFLHLLMNSRGRLFIRATMLSSKVILLMILFEESHALAESHWSVFTSPHFVLYTETENPRTSEVLQRLETVRCFFQGTVLSPGVPQAIVKIVVFGSEPEFSLYRRNPGAFAYYQRMRNHDYIAIQQPQHEYERIAVHEYTHCVVSHLGIKLPLWLHEGLAEVYSCLRGGGNVLEIGGELSTHMNSLRRSPYSLPSLIAVQSGQSGYRQPDEMQVFYARSWALSHMLQFAPQYRSRFPEFLAAFSQDASTENVLRSIYGEDLKALEQSLLRYVSHGQIRPIAQESNCGDAAVALTGPVMARTWEIPVILADLVTPATAADNELGRKLQQLARDPDASPEVTEVLGYRSLRENQPAEAITYFGSAIQHGVVHSDLLLRYAALKQDHEGTTEQVVSLLEEALRLEPSNETARLQLAWSAAKLGKYELAISTLSTTNLSPGANEFHRNYLLAYCYLRQHNFENAGVFGGNAKDLAVTSTQLREIDQLTKFLDRLNLKQNDRAISVSQPRIAFHHKTPIGRPPEAKKSGGS